MEEESTHPKYLSTQPEGIDSFGSQSQKKTATVVAELIKNSPADSRMIGLEGSWGSGKSNLVRLIEKELHQTHRVFVFDTWGHQEDLQRRAFLEELTRTLIKNKGLKGKSKKKESWDDALKNLLAKKIVTKSKQTPRLSVGIVASIAAIVLTPIASTIVEALGEDEPIWLKVLWSGLPIAGAILVWFSWRFFSKDKPTLKDLFVVYSEGATETVNHETISENEPSVVEFRDWMTDLNSGLEEDLIIVFDNIDRLPMEKAREIWSSIHTFFAEESYASISVIVPYDKLQLSGMFASDHQGEREQQCDHFLRKTFQISFRVPIPVLSEWKIFFRDCFYQAFGASEFVACNKVMDVYDSLVDIITPRNIIAFINDLVTQVKIDANVDIKYMAIFLLKKDLILLDPSKQIISKEYLKDNLDLIDNDENLANSIAALAYGVDINKAAEVTIKRQLERAMHNGDTRVFKELGEHPSFLSILSSINSSISGHLINMTRCLNILDTSKYDQAQQGITMQMWVKIATKLLGMKKGITSFQEHDWSIVNHTPPDFAERYIQKSRRLLFDQENLTAEQIQDFHRSLIIGKSESDDPDILAVQLDDIKISAEFFCKVIGLAGNQILEYKLSCDESELNDELKKYIPDQLEDIASLPSLKDEYNLSQINKEIGTQLQEQDDSEISTQLFKLYVGIDHAKLNDLELSDDTIHNVLENLSDDDQMTKDIAIAVRMARGSKFPNLRGTSMSISESTDSDLAKRVASYIENFNSFGELVLSALDWPKSLMQNIARILIIEHPAETSSMTISSVFPRYVEIKDELELEARQIVSRLNGWNNTVIKDVNIDNIHEYFVDAETITDFVKIQNEVSNHMVECSKERLEKLDEDAWKDILNAANDWEYTALIILVKAKKLAIRDSVLNAYKQCLLAIARGEMSVPIDEGWIVLFNSIHKSKLAFTIRNVRDIFLNDVEIDAARFSFFYIMLENHGKLLDRSVDSVRRIILPLLTTTILEDRIKENEDFYVELVKNMGDEDQEFKDELKRQVLAESTIEKWGEFCSKIGISFEDDKTE